MLYFFYVFAGFLAGIFGGLGMGGGTLLIPILTIFLDFEQKLAQGINLMSFLVMAIISIYIHYRNGLIVTKNIWIIIFFGVIFSVLGAFLMTYLVGPLEDLALLVGEVEEMLPVLKKVETA